MCVGVREMAIRCKKADDRIHQTKDKLRKCKLKKERYENKRNNKYFVKYKQRRDIEMKEDIMSTLKRRKGGGCWGESGIRRRVSRVVENEANK